MNKIFLRTFIMSLSFLGLNGSDGVPMPNFDKALAGKQILNRPVSDALWTLYQEALKKAAIRSMQVQLVSSENMELPRQDAVTRLTSPQTIQVTVRAGVSNELFESVL